MVELIAKLSSKNQITLPAAVRRRLGVGASDRIAFVFNEEGAIEVRRARYDLESILGSIPPLPHSSADFEQEIAETTANEVTRRPPLAK
jgi:AbrB family looped-hinge helix DNA binding protein